MSGDSYGGVGGNMLSVPLSIFGVPGAELRGDGATLLFNVAPGVTPPAPLAVVVAWFPWVAASSSSM